MKKILFISLSFALLACGEKGSIVGDRTSIEVKQLYNAGNVLKGEIVSAKYSVKNTGNSPLIIATVSGSCTCTVADFEKEPIAPGEEGLITLEIATDKAQLGKLEKTATIVANTTPSATTLIVKANITSK
jgi:hypothetical protein